MYDIVHNIMKVILSPLPEVYILVVPGFGVISLSINLFSLKNIFGSQSMVLALGCISIIGTVVWG